MYPFEVLEERIKAIHLTVKEQQEQQLQLLQKQVDEKETRCLPVPPSVPSDACSWQGDSASFWERVLRREDELRLSDEVQRQYRAAEESGPESDWWERRRGGGGVGGSGIQPSERGEGGKGGRGVGGGGWGWNGHQD